MFHVHIISYSVSEFDENEVWDIENDDSCDDRFSDNEVPDLPLNQEILQAEERDLVVWILIFVVRLQAKHYVPDAALHCLIIYLLFCCWTN